MQSSMDPKELFRRIGENLTVGRAFGPAYEVGSTTVIPVAIVAGGGGAGEGRTVSRSDPEAEEPEDPQKAQDSEGTGGGFGTFVYPLGVYVVSGDKVRFVPSFDFTRLVAGFIVFLRLLAKRSRQK